MNMQNLMAQAQKMQRDIEKKKDEIDKTLFTGKSELVEVEFNGKREMTKIKIAPQTYEQDDVEMLEDMVQIAVKDALTKIDKEIESKLGSVGNGLGGLF